MGRKLFVGNLSFNTDERRLEELFASIGQVDSVNIVRDQMTGRARAAAKDSHRKPLTASPSSSSMVPMANGGATEATSVPNPSVGRS